MADANAHMMDDKDLPEKPATKAPAKKAKAKSKPSKRGPTTTKSGKLTITTR